MPIRAVLFDVGGPLSTEELHERAFDEQIRAALRAEGVTVSDEDYAAANRWAVHSYAPNVYKAIVWRLCAGHPAALKQLGSRFWVGGPFQPREGMAELLGRLRELGLLLGLAANQPPETVATLDALGLGRYFSHREVSGTHGYRKPDLRLFLRACDDLGVPPEECVMVGDRIDNDIAPARLLGMKTVLFRTGRHVDQQPRSVDEVPDFEVHDVPALERALASLLARVAPPNP